MTAIVHTPEEAKSLEQPPLLVLRPLEAFFDEHGLGQGDITAQPVGDGHSNVTYLIARRGGAWVLRRPPRPPLPPSAHDVLREALLLRALEPTTVRVPKVLATCDDDSVIGAPFYVMERVEGTVVNDELPDGVTPARIGEELIDALVEVHATDWQACGLEGFGKPTGYLAAPGPPLHRPVGAQRHARDRRARRGHRLARRAHPGVGSGHDRPRRLPARERDVHRRPA